MSRNNVEKQLVQQPGGAQSQWDYTAGGFKAIERKMHNSKSQDKIIDSVFKDLQYKGALWTLTTCGTAARWSYVSIQCNLIQFCSIYTASNQSNGHSEAFIL